MPLPVSATPTIPASHSLERFDAYVVARDFTRLARTLPMPDATLRDQWRRASLSVFLNLAEGAGRTARADKRRLYSIARGEAFECAAMLDLVEHAPAELGELLSRVIAMLTRLVR